MGGTHINLNELMDTGTAKAMTLKKIVDRFIGM